MGSSISDSKSFGDDFEVLEKSCGTYAFQNAGNNLPRRILSRVFSEDYHVVKEKTYDPQGSAIHTWNSIFFAACLTSLFLDPLFFLLPQAKKEICVDLPTPIEVALTAARSCVDVFYIIHLFVQFRSACAAPSSSVIRRGDLVVNPLKVASRYLSKQFWLYSLAAQPIPQVIIWIVIPSLNGSSVDRTNHTVRLCILAQYLLRLYLIVPLCTHITKATGVVLETAWAGAAFNLMLYLMASHIFGCLWYLLAIERQEDCWREMCGLEVDCHLSFLDCRFVHNPIRASWLKSTNVSRICDPSSGLFDFGIYSGALTSGVTLAGFFRKFFFCLWWALRNLNSLGQDLATSTNAGEINYAMIFGIVSLVLFGLLIGNMQTYLQSATARLERWRTWKSDTELWMHHRQLPHGLRQNVRRHNQYKWWTTRGVDEEAILKSLPVDLRHAIKRHLCLDLVRKVPLFNMMDAHMLDAICEKLKPRLYDKGNCLEREGYPVAGMLFIVRGRLDSYTTGGGRTGFFNSSFIGPGDFCGEELLTWALDPRPNMILPSSTRTVIAITEVEAFAFLAEDLKCVASQFSRLINRPLRHVFRLHSHQWRTWAACSIQAAWYRYKKRKEAAEFERLQFAYGLTVGQTSPSLLQAATNFTIYAAKPAASTRRSNPEEPDFTVGN